MKKWIAIAALCLLLTGCGAEEQEKIVLPDPVEAAPVEQTQEAPAAELPIEKVPLEVTPEEPAEELTEDAPEGAIDTYAISISSREGLVEDAIGYALDVPTFEGFPAAEAVDKFYVDLVDHLENYTKETVYAQVLEKGTMANVFGTVVEHALEGGLEIRVVYELRVEFADGTEPVVNSRTDYFQVQTGEVRSETN